MCEHPNPPGAAFCSACGAALPHRRCRCGAASAAEAKFCRNCGASLASPAPGTDGARPAAARGKYDLARFLDLAAEPAKRPAAERKKLTQNDIRQLLGQARPGEP